MWDWGFRAEFFGSLWPWAWEIGSGKTWCKPHSFLGCIRPKGLTKKRGGGGVVPDLSLRTESKFHTPANDICTASIPRFLGFILTILEWANFFLLFPIEPLHLPKSCVNSPALLQRFPSLTWFHFPHKGASSELWIAGHLFFYAVWFPFVNRQSFKIQKNTQLTPAFHFPVSGRPQMQSHC